MTFKEFFLAAQASGRYSNNENPLFQKTSLKSKYSAKADPIEPERRFKPEKVFGFKPKPHK